MEARDQIGSALPIICPRHPEKAKLITKPGEIPLYAPAGGCVLPCDARLSCGHICPSAVCTLTSDILYLLILHASATLFSTTIAAQNAWLLATALRVRGNILARSGARTIVGGASSQCTPSLCPADTSRRRWHGEWTTMSAWQRAVLIQMHTSYQLEDLASVQCDTKVVKKLPGCEHSARTECHRDPSTVWCSEPCGGTLSCCTKTCKAGCSSCRSLTLEKSGIEPRTAGKVLRTHHKDHPCERLLYCEHECRSKCHPKDQDCNSSCKETCRQQCVHNKCKKPCSEPCAPCMEPCVWTCAHMTCPVLCGSVWVSASRIALASSPLASPDLFAFAMR